jgi:hypothetical protein
MSAASAARGLLVREAGLPAAVLLAGVAALTDVGHLAATGAAALGAVLPGWAAWYWLDHGWAGRPLLVRFGLAVVGSVALAEVVLYWGCLGGEVAGERATLLLAATCLALWALGAWRRRGREGAGGAEEAGLRAQLGLSAVCVVFAVLVALPWAANNRQCADGLSQAPCSGDWSKHRSLTYAVLDTGVPPRNPFLVRQELTYYYGLYLGAAGLVRMSGGHLGVDGALRLLSVLLALATPAVLFELARATGASDAVATASAGVVVLVGGLDVVVLWGLRATLGLGFWDLGHAGSWTSSPRIPFPYSNLHWAPQHHAGALMALCVALVLVVAPGRRAGNPLLVALLTAGCAMSSVYVGIVLVCGCGAWALVCAAPGSRSHGQALGPAGAVMLGVCLGLLGAAGVLTSARHMVDNSRSRVALGWPRLDYADWAVRAALQRPPAPDGAPAGPRSTGGAPLAGSAWLRQTPYADIAQGLGGLLGVVLQLGLVGLIAVRGLGLAGPGGAFWALALAAWFAALFTRNFDLQMRAAGLGWMLLVVPVAATLSAWVRDAGGRGRKAVATAGAACVLLGAPGLGTTAYEVAGMGRPVYFDAHDRAVMSWARDHTPAAAVIQAFPDTYPRIVSMPRERYFVRPSYPEFTGRCAVLGDAEHIRMFATPDDVAGLSAALSAAFTAPTPLLARTRFRNLGVDFVLWTSREERAGRAEARRNLLSAEAFGVVFRDGGSFLARVR